MLAGGLTDGSICLWNPAKIVRSPAGTTDEGSGAAITTLRKHSGPVKGLEFNASSPNLLASGSTDGDLVIWDVAQPSAAASYQLVRRCAASGALMLARPDAAVRATNPGLFPHWYRNDHCYVCYMQQVTIPQAVVAALHGSLVRTSCRRVLPI